MTNQIYAHKSNIATIKDCFCILKEALFHVKPYTPTDLEIWMKEQGLSDSSLAVKLREDNVTVSARQIARWRRMGTVMPRREALAALSRLSDGRITANTFFEATP